MPRRRRKTEPADHHGSIRSIASFVRARRRALGYTQPELAERTGTGVRFVRELERGKTSLRLDKVNQVLAFFGAHLAPAPAPDDEGPP